MLNQIRGAMKNVVVFFVIALLILAFAAWGVPEIRQLTRSDALRVGAEGFSAAQVQKQFDRFVTNQRNRNQGQFDRSEAIRQGLHTQIIQSMATQSAIDQEATRLGLTISRPMVTKYLQTSDQFKNPQTGKFDNTALEGIMREYGFTIREFEEQIRSELLRNQLLSTFGVRGPAPRAMAETLVTREIEKRKVSYVTITDEIAGARPAANETTLKDYYEKNKAQFMAPEYRTFTTIILKNDQFATAGAADEKALRQIFDANKARYETPERRTIYQITYVDEAKATAAVAALKGGAPFEKIATENGQALADVTFTDISKSDILDPKAAAAAFASDAAAGAVVGPVKGVFGAYVAQVVAVTPATAKTFEEVRGEIESQFVDQDTRRKLFERIDEIENERDTGATLAAAAAAHGVAAKEYGPVDSFSFNKGGGILSDIPAEVLKTAFETEEGDESEATELEDKSGFYFVSINEVIDPAPVPFETVRAEVETRWRTADAEARIAAAMQKLREALKAKKSLADAAGALGVAPVTIEIDRRSAGTLFSEVMIEQVFAAQKGQTASGPNGAGGAQALVLIDDVTFDTARVRPEDITGYAGFVGTRLNQELIDAYANAVRKDHNVKINQKQIDALFAEGP